MKVALVHDYLIEAGGAERVLKVLSEMYLKAPIYTALVKKNGSAYAYIKLREFDIFESKWGWFLKIGRFYSYFRFLLPWIWRSIDLRDYDLVITSCSGYIARGFRVKPEAKVIAYCHTPPRWLYGYDTPTGAHNAWWGKAFMWIVGPPLRYFDFQSAQRVDTWIANSHEVAGRIAKFYRKPSIVVYPPIEVNPKFETRNSKQSYYLMVSRIVGGKGIKEASYAFKKLGIRLKIVGEIVDKKLGKEVESLGRVSEDELVGLYTNAKGFVALARDEDFGMTVVEAMLCGTPVLAFNGGGYRETVVDKSEIRNSKYETNQKLETSKKSEKRTQTGILINGTDTKSIKAGIERMEKVKWDRAGIKKWARRFGRERFEQEVREIVGR